MGNQDSEISASTTYSTAGPILMLLSGHPKAGQERPGHAMIGVAVDIYGYVRGQTRWAAGDKLDTPAKSSQEPCSARVAVTVAVRAKSGQRWCTITIGYEYPLAA
jgi:hypothetical protein